MNIAEGQKILEQAFPGKVCTINQTLPGRGAYCIEVDGELKARAFDLMKGLQEACLPVLEQARADHAANERAKQELFKQFGIFLQERFKDEFEAWIIARTEAKPATGMCPECGNPPNSSACQTTHP